MDIDDKPDYRHLPEPIRLEDTRAELDTREVPDPNVDVTRSATSSSATPLRSE